MSGTVGILSPSFVLSVGIALGLFFTGVVVVAAPRTRPQKGKRLSDKEIYSAIYSGMEASMSIMIIVLSIFQSEELGAFKEMLVPIVIRASMVRYSRKSSRMKKSDSCEKHS